MRIDSQQVHCPPPVKSQPRNSTVLGRPRRDYYPPAGLAQSDGSKAIPEILLRQLCFLTPLVARMMTAAALPVHHCIRKLPERGRPAITERWQYLRHLATGDGKDGMRREVQRRTHHPIPSPSQMWRVLLPPTSVGRGGGFTCLLNWALIWAITEPR